MAKKGKIGKQRKDKFYKLAKETGFRSRASFKLIQLNRKFEFLPKARVLVDLCAAPGGWLQVAKQSMPVSSVLIGVDIAPIKAIPNVITFQEDITTDRCRQAIRKELKTWKADVFLHDGAPNMGKNWFQDAFSQNQLVLSALKLSTEFLAKGGWFISKVFRSKDYLSLVWVFKKLFKHVHVTKPQASRNESAEIFVVCQNYLAPDRIDPKFLDPIHMFKDVQNKNDAKTDILNPSKKKPKAVGYDDDDPLFHILKATEFIFSDNHVERLGKCNEIILDDVDIRDHKLTTYEVKQCCKDVKVLGKADIRLLLNWRKQLRQIIKKAEENDENTVKEIDDLQKEEEELDEALQEAEEMELSKLQAAKKKKKKILKERRKVHERLNLKMIIREDNPIVEEDMDLFKLSQIKNKKDLTKVEDEMDLEFGIDPSIPEDVQEMSFRSTYAKYKRHEKHDDFDIEEDKNSESDDSSNEALSSEMEFESESEKENEDEVTETILEGRKNPLMVDLVQRPERVHDTVQKWFDKDDFADGPEGNDIELDLLAETLEQKEKSNKDDLDDENDSSDDDMQKKTNVETENVIEFDDTSNKGKKKKIKLNPEGLALGSIIIQSKKMRRDIIDNSYNRYASNDDGLPKWFVDDEKKHFKVHLPVTKEMVADYKMRLREIDARPVKKVVEAKARKKRKNVRRLEKARKKAEKITEHPDMTAYEKAEQLKSIYRKAVPKSDKKVTYIVARKNGVRPRVKGKYKIVDKRMKKDNRMEKLNAKNQKKSKGRKSQKSRTGGRK